MLLIEKIKNAKLSYVQRQIGDYIISHSEDMKKMTLKLLAENTYTSSATIIRFIRKLGYEKYDLFKEDFVRESEYLNKNYQFVDANLPFDSKDSIQKIASKITILAKETLDDTLSLMTHDDLQKSIRIFEKTNVIHLYAMSYPLLYGEEFRLNMKRIGKMVEIENILGEEYFTLNIVSKDDCALFISYSGGHQKQIEIAEKLKEKNIPIIVISSIGDNPLKNLADVCLNITTREKLFSKINNFSNAYSIHLILDILFSSYFSKKYDENLNQKIQLSQFSEKDRKSFSKILDEK